jgi:hypothetical protein
MAKDPFDAAAEAAASGADDEDIGAAFEAAEKEMLKEVSDNAREAAGGETSSQYDRQVRESSLGGGGQSQEMDTFMKEWPAVRDKINEIHEMMNKIGTLG